VSGGMRRQYNFHPRPSSARDGYLQEVYRSGRHTCSLCVVQLEESSVRLRSGIGSHSTSSEVWRSGGSYPLLEQMTNEFSFAGGGSGLLKILSGPSLGIAKAERSQGFEKNCPKCEPRTLHRCRNFVAYTKIGDLWGKTRSTGWKHIAHMFGDEGW
jgi:hypothetical protein